MTALLLVLPVFAVALLCRLLFALAVRALAFYVGAELAIFSFDHGTGLSGAIIAGLFAGTAMETAIRTAFFAVNSRLGRALIAFLFAAPASIVGYHASLAISGMAIPSNGWRVAFAILGAALVGGAALARVTGTTAPPIDRYAATAHLEPSGVTPASG